MGQSGHWGWPKPGTVSVGQRGGDVWEWPGLAYVLAGAVTAGLAYYGADLLTGAR